MDLLQCVSEILAVKAASKTDHENANAVGRQLRAEPWNHTLAEIMRDALPDAGVTPDDGGPMNWHGWNQSAIWPEPSIPEHPLHEAYMGVLAHDLHRALEPIRQVISGEREPREGEEDNGMNHRHAAAVARQYWQAGLPEARHLMNSHNYADTHGLEPQESFDRHRWRWATAPEHSLGHDHLLIADLMRHMPGNPDVGYPSRRAAWEAYHTAFRRRNEETRRRRMQEDADSE